jgi:hypothetical protein
MLNYVVINSGYNETSGYVGGFDLEMLEDLLQA